MRPSFIEYLARRERAMLMQEMRATGSTWKEIGKRLKIGGPRAAQCVSWIVRYPRAMTADEFDSLENEKLQASAAWRSRQ